MTTPPTTATGAIPVPQRGPSRRWDLVLSIVLIVIDVGLGLVLLVLAPLLTLAVDSCGSGAVCYTEQMGLGVDIALVGPVLVLTPGIAATVVLLVLRRPAFRVPLAAMVLAGAVFALGAALVVTGVTGPTF